MFSVLSFCVQYVQNSNPLCTVIYVFIVRWTESSWFDFCVVAIQYRMVTVVNFVTYHTFCKVFDLCFKMVTIKEQWER